MHSLLDTVPSENPLFTRVTETSRQHPCVPATKAVRACALTQSRPKPKATAEQRSLAADAAYAGDSAALRRLAAVADLEVNAPVPSPLLVGYTAPPHYMLHYACAQGHVEAARALVSELGARLQVGDGEGGRPLAWAAYRGQLGMARLTLGLGAEIRTARRHSSSEEVSALLDAAAAAGRR